MIARSGQATTHGPPARPALARLLDDEEARLPMKAEILAPARAVQARVEAVLARRRDDLGLVEPGPAALDLLFITRGLIDGVARSGAPDVADLEARVRAAIQGHLRERRLVAPDPGATATAWPHLEGASLVHARPLVESRSRPAWPTGPAATPPAAPTAFPPPRAVA